MNLLLNKTACTFIWYLYIFACYDDEQSLDFFFFKEKQLTNPLLKGPILHQFSDIHFSVLCNGLA